MASTESVELIEYRDAVRGGSLTVGRPPNYRLPRARSLHRYGSRWVADQLLFGRARGLPPKPTFASLPTFRKSVS